MLLIKDEVPHTMIKFKNKSEQTRYIRVANCIMSLNDTSMKRTETDVEFLYMKIFRFLADVLTPDEFQNLNYYHVSRFIDNILHLAFRSSKKAIKELPQMSLRMFVCYGLDLQYYQRQQSADILQQTSYFNRAQAQAQYAQEHWTKAQDQQVQDINLIYSEREMTPVNQLGLKESAEDRHQQIQEQISRRIHTFAHEPSLPNVVRNKFFREKETIKRENLARLLKHGKKQDDIDYSNLTKQSILARNYVMTEHIVQ